MRSPRRTLLVLLAALLIGAACGNTPGAPTPITDDGSPATQSPAAGQTDDADETEDADDDSPSP